VIGWPRGCLRGVRSWQVRYKGKDLRMGRQDHNCDGTFVLDMILSSYVFTIPQHHSFFCS
jgi:hypothetical protein